MWKHRKQYLYMSTVCSARADTLISASKKVTSTTNTSTTPQHRTGAPMLMNFENSTRGLLFQNSLPGVMSRQKILTIKLFSTLFLPIEQSILVKCSTQISEQIGRPLKYYYSIASLLIEPNDSLIAFDEWSVKNEWMKSIKHSTKAGVECTVRQLRIGR